MFAIFMHNTTTNKRGAEWGKQFNNYETAKAYLRAVYAPMPDKYTVSIWRVEENKPFDVWYLDVI